jgi:hypothetical protein
MRDDPHYRCLAIIERVPEIRDFIHQIALHTHSDVVYVDEVAEMDDLDFTEKSTAVTSHVDDRTGLWVPVYEPEGYRYHCGSLWARREQDLVHFWHCILETYGESFSARVPRVFTYDTLSPLFD